MHIAKSKNGVPIRLTNERWLHITESHSEMAGCLSEILEAIECPDAIYLGGSSELLAAKEVQNDKYIIVVYKEESDEDGFVITAFLTRRIRQFEKRQMIWAPQK